MRALPLWFASGFAAVILASCNLDSEVAGGTAATLDESPRTWSTTVTTALSSPGRSVPGIRVQGSAPPMPAIASTTTTTSTLVPSNELELTEVAVITGDIAPKSVVASGNGLFFAQNMMYRHTVTVYNRSFELVTTISDTVDLAAFDIEASGRLYQGAPVEAAMAPVAGNAYVSNYQMFGVGYQSPGGDECDPGVWDDSFVYRIPFATLEIDQVIRVGAVPKFLALTPDERLLLVTNWCTNDLSVVDTALGHEIARVPLGRHPRGIVVSGDGKIAYVAVMGSSDVAVVDLDSFEIAWLVGVGANPRHLLLDSTDSYLFVTLNGEGRVVKVDLATGQVVASIETGSAPRSMALSADGSSLYVVNYGSDTVSKVDSDSMRVIQNVTVPSRPIGITFDPESRQIWVASYSGAISVFEER